MESRNDIDKKVEEILQSLDGMQRAAPQPWFYTRLQARLQREEKTGWVKVGSFLAKPVVAIAGLCLILVMNAILLLKQDNQGITPDYASQAEWQLATDNEAILASTSSFDYENLVQP